jgi:Tol biopolymer transport system component
LALTPGTRLGVYEIIAQIGEGGMGQVYRARDTTLNRDVALKVLPDAFVSDPDRLARFTREAQTLAALNHPNIAHIHGLEESHPSAGSGQAAVRALVMELVEGDDLVERIARGPIPLDEALPIARQIAEALEAAHGQGIIHRDLKPANIKVRNDGAVKVLDFGLAKAMDPLSSSSAVAALANSPTITNAAAMTAAGIILGTAAYMSPEQARGKVVDKRTDLWALGCVLYEMLTGLRPFGGDDVTDTIAAVVRADPDWSKLRADTPAAIRRLLRRCLEKDRLRRLSDAADARLEIDDALSPLAGDPNMEPAAHLASGAVVAGWQRVLPWASTGALAAGLAAVLMLWAPWRAAPPPRVTRMTITPSGPAALTINGADHDLALSPDGTHVVYVANGGTQLFVRALDALEPVAIATGGVRGPFVSPDGQWVGFVNNNTVQKVAITGGPPITLASIGGPPRGATWSPDDTIIFATGDLTTGLQRVSAAGGTPEVLTRPDHAQGEADHLWPEILPGGRAVLFTITSQTGGLDTAQLVVRDLRTGTNKVLLRGGSHAHYVASGLASPKRAEREGGHLVYVAAGTLRAIPFDPNGLETHGTAVPVLPRLATTSFGAGDFAVAADGTLVYVDVPGGLAANARTLVWVDRTGKEEPVAAPPRAYEHPRLSPDGTRVALAIGDQENDLWIWDLGRATLRRLTLDPGQDWFPVWTPNGRQIVFSSNRGGQNNLWWQAADGTGAAERLTTSSNPQLVTGITPAGTADVFNEQTPTMGRDLLQLALDGTRRVTPLLQTKFDERNGIVSPDGRWLLYESNSSGLFEIYVRPFPNVGGGQWEVSTAGGTRPLWSRSGKELFYVGADGALLRVPVEASGATWNAGTPTKLLEGRYFTAGGGGGRTYDVSPDGQRFLMIKAPVTDASAAPPALIVVQHWTEELKRLVPSR